MRSPAISRWLKGTTLAKGTAKGAAAARDAEPLATAGSAQGSPYRDDIVTDGDAVHRRQIGKGAAQLMPADEVEQREKGEREVEHGCRCPCRSCPQKPIRE
jgi:hypothetical protein